MSYLLGLDAGTSLVKAALFDRDLAEVAVVARPTTLKSPAPGWAEVSMTETWNMAASAIRAVVEKAGILPQQIKAVGITGNMVGAWLIDEHGAPVRDAILHIDNRTQPWIEHQTAKQPDFLETIFRYSGSAMQPGCSLPLVRWLADNEPRTLQRTRYVLCCKDWLIYQLTGAIQVDPSEASVMPGDTRKRAYAEELFDLMGIRAFRDRFPPIVPSHSIVGAVTAEAAAVIGLAAGTPVSAGAGDVLATSLGAGAVKNGVAYTILGTALINGLVMDEPDLDPVGIGLTFCQPGDRWVRVMVNTLGTPNLDWCIRLLFPDISTQSAPLFQELETRANHSGVGSRGLIFLPYLSPTGVFAPFVEPAARAEFFGLTVDHTRDDMLRAVYEGIAFSIRDCYDALPRRVDEIRLTGGGANSAFWSQMIADVTGKRVTITQAREFGARGAALLAGIGIGWYEGVEVASEMTPTLRRHNPEAHPDYDAAYRTYTTLAQALRVVWKRH